MTKIYSINIAVVQGLDIKDYVELHKKVKDAVMAFNEPITIGDADGRGFTTDFIQSVDLIEKTEIDIDIEEDN